MLKRHVLLTGLSGAGKSTVGPLLSVRLRAHYLDIDQVVEGLSGRTIAEIFATDGEKFFRAEERRLLLEMLQAPPTVLALGAGWAAEPGAIAEARQYGALLVHLAVSPDVAAARLGACHGRPLLGGEGNLVERLTLQAEARAAAYAMADITVPTDGLDGYAVTSLLVKMLPADLLEPPIA